MDGVVLDMGAESLAQRAFRGFRRVGGAHEVAMSLDGLLAFQRNDNNRSGGHEAAQAVEERPLLVDVVKAFSLGLRKPHELHRHRHQSGLLVALQDGSALMPPGGIGLDNGKRPFDHCRL